MSFLAELEQLRLEASALAWRFAAARAGAAGTDPTGTVEVAVNGDGEVDAVTIDPTWRRQFGPDGLGGALAAATADASHRWLALWAERLAAADDPRPADPVDTGPAAEPVDLDHLRYLVVEAADRLRDVDALTAVPGLGSSTDRRVRITVEHGHVTAVDFDRGWLHSAAPTTIAEHARQALRAAFAAATAPGPRSRAVDEVRALTADPAAFLRRLGLD